MITLSSILVLVAFNGHAQTEGKPEDAHVNQSAKADEPVLSSAPMDKLNEATLTFTSSGMPMHVEYELSVNQENCQGFERVGKVFDSGRKVLLPWIARLTERANKAVMGTNTTLSKKVAGNKAIQIRGNSNWQTAAGSGWQSGSCGPLTLQFVPGNSKTYQVDFAFRDGGCAQSVFDTTDPLDKKVVAVQPISGCSR